MIMNTEIYIAAHKEFKAPKLDSYIPIEVGTALREKHFGYILDDDGENISNKNGTFCELTAYYWIWKNSTADIVGLCHYRRYFSRKRLNYDERLFFTKNNFEKILETYDIILPEKFYWRHHTVASAYDWGEGFAKDLEILRDIIKKRHPEYIETYDLILKETSASYCNMLVCKKNIFNKYCEWLFDILFEAENIIDISDYTVSEKRIFGYMSEILLNVWVRYNTLSCCYLPIVFNGYQGKKAKLLSYVDKIDGVNCLTKCVNCKDDIF